MSAQPNPAFMKRAIGLATENVLSAAGGPFGAVIVKDGRVVSEAVNTVTRTNDPTAHAEINAIRAACLALESFTLQGCEIYSSCEPCPMCLAAIYWARMDRIYYGNTAEDAAKVDFDDAFLYRELVLSHADRSIPCHQLLGPEAWESFQAWQESEHKIDY